jgi:hypothetical protein
MNALSSGSAGTTNSACGSDMSGGAGGAAQSDGSPGWVKVWY